MKLSGKFIVATKEFSDISSSVAAPYLRRRFNVEKTLVRAGVTICGLGFYELFINGEKITKGLLSPYISNPDDFLYYDSYDIEKYIVKGENVIGLQLGNGMQNAFGGYVWDFQKAPFRSAPKVALCLETEYADGSTEEFEADEHFLCTASPILSDDLRLGETYDARREIPGWNLPGFNDSGWVRPLVAVEPRGEKRICTVNPITVRKTLKPVNIVKEDDSYIYDFGQNAAGLCRLNIRGTAGQTVTLTYGEYLKNGKFTTDNITFNNKDFGVDRPYIQQDVYICAGTGVEEYIPQFTYHGFRYVRVDGINNSQATDNLLTFNVMNTELREIGGFSCSDPVLNKLQHMTRESTLSNFYHFPTDCPQREKNGWTADAALSCEHTLLNLNPEINYKEWLRNVCAAMDSRGALPGIVPTGGWGFEWGNGPAWDCVLTELPYRLYTMRGDLSAAKECAPFIFRYIEYLRSRTEKNGLIAIGLGDWCAPHFNIKSPLEFTDTVTSVDICRKAATLFGALSMKYEQQLAQKTADDFRAAVRENLLCRDTMTFAGDCQTSQAMAIYYGITEPQENKKAVSVLLKKIEETDGHIDCGVLGARVLFRVLTEYGYGDLAYKILVNPTPPSYAYWITFGNTALAEDFYYDKEPVESRNHHFLGDISAWFIESIGGININPSLEGVNTLKIAPHFLFALDSAEAFHVSPYGKISVRWKKATDNAVTLELLVPPMMEGDVILSEGWKFPDGKTSAPAMSGTYKIIK